MSRTDHHRPWQIRAADRVDVKGNDPAYYRHDGWFHQSLGECSPRCGWTLPHSTLMHPPREFRRRVWFGPERRREREDLGALAREYNTHGDVVDGDFPCLHHRHQAHMDWI